MREPTLAAVGALIVAAASAEGAVNPSAMTTRTATRFMFENLGGRGRRSRNIIARAVRTSGRHDLALVAPSEVFLNPRARAAPRTVGGLGGGQAPPRRGHA